MSAEYVRRHYLRNAAYGVLIVVVPPAAMVLSIVVDRARVWRNSRRWAR